ncbi:hypothetical protein F5050DRAFT_892164 [Lentinula boryana]|uniref:Uncharacterized protein n=1 Tax=Lentinula boryana TaxID=40481 RepID=A0ABQ8Q2G8_9AGAR|nr:hypothetical protein F5050DRAFT_892164 [Lentinula boryana]
MFQFLLLRISYVVSMNAPAAVAHAVNFATQNQNYGLLDLFKGVSKAKGINAANKGAKPGAEQNRNSNRKSAPSNGKKMQVVAMPMGVATREDNGDLSARLILVGAAGSTYSGIETTPGSVAF